LPAWSFYDIFIIYSPKLIKAGGEMPYKKHIREHLRKMRANLNALKEDPHKSGQEKTLRKSLALLDGLEKLYDISEKKSRALKKELSQKKTRLNKTEETLRREIIESEKAGKFIHNNEKKLIKHHRKLEKKVKERTKELETMNEKLLREAGERKKAEKILRDNEKRLRMILDATSDGVWDYNLKTGEAFHSWVKALGYNPEEIPNEIGAFTELLHPDDRKKTIDKINRVLKSLSIDNYSFEFRMRNKQGEWRWILSRGKVVSRDEKNRPFRLLGTHCDITEHKLAEEALRANSLRYRKLFNNVYDAVLTTKLEKNRPGPFIEVNKAACKLTGFEKETLIGMDPSEIIAAGKSPAREMIGKLARNQNTLFELPIITKSKKRLIAEVRSHIFNMGNEKFMILLMRDITSRRQAENKLRLSEERLRLVLEATSDGLWEWNIEDNTFRYDRRIISLLKLPEHGKEFEARTFNIFKEAIHPEDRERFEIKMKKHLKGNTKTFDCSLRIKSKSNRHEWFLCRAIAIRDLSGKPVTVVGSIEDIEERRRFDELKEQFEFQQKLIDAIPIPVYYKDLHGRYIGCNKSMLSFFNTTKDRLIGKTVFDFKENDTETGHKIQASERDFLKTGKSFLSEMEIIIDKRKYNIMTYKSLLFAKDDTPECVVGALIDISRQKTVENALREAQLKLNTILDTMREIIICHDNDMKIMWANKAALETFMKTEKDIIGKLCHEVCFSAGIPCGDCPVVKARASGKMESSLIKSSGERFFEIYGYPVNNYDGNSSGSVEVILDVTERENVRIKAEENKEKLIQADKMNSLGFLVAGVAHEINNPTNYIMINISILRKIWNSLLPLLKEYSSEHGSFQAGGINSEDMASQLPDLIFGIEEGADRIKNIVDNLKDYARPSPIDMSGTVDINTAVERSIVLMTSLIKRSTNKFHLEYGEKIPEVKGDIRRIEQVIINLVQNACHALENKEKALYIKTYRDTKNAKAIVEVRDEGRGISPENMKHISDPFFTTRRDSGGTGLGLSISLSIINDHNGVLEFDSAPGKGTTAKIILPVKNSRTRNISN